MNAITYKFGLTEKKLYTATLFIKLTKEEAEDPVRLDAIIKLSINNDKYIIGDVKVI